MKKRRIKNENKYKTNMREQHERIFFRKVFQGSKNIISQVLIYFDSNYFI